MPTRALAIACALIAQTGLSAEQLKPRVNVDFGVGTLPKPQPQPPPVTFGLTVDQTKPQREAAAKAAWVEKAMARRSEQREAFDCKMVRPVDPNFRSAMPVAKPPEHTKFSMKVIPVPPCPAHK